MLSLIFSGRNYMAEPRPQRPSRLGLRRAVEAAGRTPNMIVRMKDNAPLPHSRRAEFTREYQRLVEEAGRELTPDELVDAARNESCEFHDQFHWNDAVAATVQRRQRARTVLNSFEVRVRVEGTEIKMNAMVNVKVENPTPGRTRAYVPARDALESENYYQQTLDSAIRDLRAFTEKYTMLQEMREVIVVARRILDQNE